MRTIAAFEVFAVVVALGGTTLPVLVFARLHHGLKPEINALATLLILVIGIFVVVANRLQARRERRA